MKTSIIAACLILAFVQLCLGQKVVIDNTPYNVESETPFHITLTQADDPLSSLIKFKEYNPTEVLMDRAAAKSKTAKTEKNPLDILPRFEGYVIPGAVSTQWSSKCFKNNNATVKLSADGKTATLTIVAKSKNSIACADWYFIASRDSFFIKAFVFDGAHTMHIDLKSSNEILDVQEHGFRVFSVQESIFGEIADAWAIFKIFDGFRVVQDNVDFLTKMMGMKFIERPTQAQSLYIDPKFIKSGDFLGITRLDGLDPSIMYFSGSRFGHTAVALWIDGELYVCESTAPNPFGSVYWPAPYGVIHTPWKQWFEQAIKAQYHVIVMPLRPDLSAKFDGKAAADFFNQTKGMPYGFHNFIYTIVDTVDGNWPDPLDTSTLSVALALLDKIIGGQVKLMFIDALNMRFKNYLKSNAQCNDMDCVYGVLQTYNTTLGEVMKMIELDEWTYYDGKSMVCDVFVMSIYKAAGIMGPIRDQIQATEFTPKDLYELNIFDSNWQRPAVCNVDNYSYCQILGKYYWDVPTINTITPYAHMFETCASTPPTYARSPANC